EIATRSRGTPRTANNLLRWVRDYVQVKAEGKITAELADRALTMLEIDRDGFDQWDKRIIETLIHKFNGGPVGLNSLAVAIGEEAGTIEEVNEPYLIMEGYIKRTPQGRVVWVQGEISNYKLHPSGHQYFTLKDQRAQIACVIWRDTLPRKLSGQPLVDGTQVQVYGTLTVFEARGQYQLNVQILQPRGV